MESIWIPNHFFIVAKRARFGITPDNLLRNGDESDESDESDAAE